MKVNKFVELQNLERNFKDIQENNLKICDPSSIINRSFDLLKDHIKETENVDIEWIKEGLLTYCTKANQSKYTPEMRRFFCSFIHILIKNGSSQTQAITLLAHIMSPNSINGFYREALDSYNEFKAIPLHDLNINYLTINTSNIYDLVIDILENVPKHKIDIQDKPKAFINTYEIYEEILLKFFNKVNEFGYADIDIGNNTIELSNSFLLSENNEMFGRVHSAYGKIPFNERFK